MGRSVTAGRSSRGFGPGFAGALVAGAACGVVAAAAAVMIGALLYSWRAPPVRSPAGSAFTAALLGAVLFWLLAHVAARPRTWLWVTALAVATVMSLVELFLPSALQPLPGVLRWLAGLIEPVEQVLRALGVVRGAATPPIRGRFLEASIAMHYAVAVSAGLLIPRFCGVVARRRR